MSRDDSKNVHATVISQHVIAPERSSRSGNVASTKVDKRQDGPEQARQHPSRYLELLAIAYTSENPNARRLDGQREMQLTPLTCAQTVKMYARGPSSLHVCTNFKDERFPFEEDN